MSEIYRPVVIGSRAADLGGFTPAWRRGEDRVSDLDIVCSREQAMEIAALAGRSFREHVFGRAAVRSGGLWIDMDFGSKERLALVRELSPCQRRITFGGLELDVCLAPAEVVWATIISTVGLNPAKRERAIQDAAWYDEIATQLTDRHRELAELYRRDRLKEALSKVIADDFVHG